jgi:Concanavalin A-like lectin/glucanases superfamily/HYR domain
MSKKAAICSLVLMAIDICFDLFKNRMRQGKLMSIFNKMTVLLLPGLLFLASSYSAGQTPIAYYKFDDNAADNSGYNNDGAIRGLVKPTADRFGNPCGAMFFDGQTGFIEVPSSPSLESPSSALTIAVWYKLSDVPGPSKWLTAVCKGLGSSELQNPQYRLQVQQTPGLVSAICRNRAGSSTISINTPFTKCDDNFYQHSFEADIWCFYAIVYDGAKVSAYMNDAKVFEQPYTGGFAYNNSPLHIGLDEPGLTEYFSGSLDDLRIYAQALSETEILNLYNDQQGASKETEEFTLEAPGNIKAFAAGTGCATAVIFKEPASISLCSPVTVMQTAGQPSGSLFDCGRHLISYTATSLSGYVQSCSFYIQVYDTISPVLNIPADTVIYINKGDAGAVYKYNQPTAADNCGTALCTLTAGNNSGDLFRPGVNKVTYMAKDNYGNKAVKTFKVEVREKKADLSITDSPAIVKTGPVKPPPLPVPVPPQQKVDSAAKTVKKTLPPDSGSNNAVKIDSADIIKITDFKKRKILKTNEIELESQSLRIELYDNAEIDHDTVSLFLNKQPLILSQFISDRPVQLTISIDSLIDNELSLYAENLGSIPPNTALMILYPEQQWNAYHQEKTKMTNICGIDTFITINNGQ